MKSYIWLLLVVPGLALGIGLCRGAPDGPTGLQRGTVLLMHTGRTMEGDIVRKGNVYAIQRGPAEVTIPVENVLRLCQDWDEAVQFMRSRTHLGDPEERLRLAKWCHINNLREYALEEAREALKMQPANKEARQLCEIFERSVKAAANGPTTPAETMPSLPPPPKIDISAESMTQFTTKVEPILLNTCFSCHAAGKGGNFQLSRSYEGGKLAATQRNLAVVLSQVKLDRPTFSPLLIKAVSLHGNLTQPPIRSRQAFPFITLQDWVESVVVNNPHLREQSWSPPVYAAPTLPSYQPPPVKNGSAKLEPVQPLAPGGEKAGGTEFGVLSGPIVSTERVNTSYRVNLPPQNPEPIKAPTIPEPKTAVQPKQPEREDPGFIPAEFPKLASQPQPLYRETPPDTKLYPPQAPATAPGLQQTAAFPAEAATPFGVAAQPKTTPVTTTTPGRDVYDPNEFNRVMHRR